MVTTMFADSTQPTKLSSLQEYYRGVRDRFHNTHQRASSWLGERSLEVDNFKQASQQLLAAASLAGGLAVNQPVDVLLAQQLQELQDKNTRDGRDLMALKVEEHQAILDKMLEYVGRPPGHLSEEEQLYLEQQLADMLGFEVTNELDGNRLNHSIGIMGGEQHLKRFPGDDISQHDKYQEAGMAPGRGAFGWFTENGVLTEEAIMRERFYFAVQTLYLPDWNTNHPTLKPWYKFRKMIVINPAERVAAVGVVGDAGPAQWVGKQFGGSPEIIRDARIWSPASRGRVMLLFVDDPHDQVPLGIIDLDPKTMLAQVESTDERNN